MSAIQISLSATIACEMFGVPQLKDVRVLIFMPSLLKYLILDGEVIVNPLVEGSKEVLIIPGI